MRLRIGPIRTASIIGAIHFDIILHFESSVQDWSFCSAIVFLPWQASTRARTYGCRVAHQVLSAGLCRVNEIEEHHQAA